MAAVVSQVGLQPCFAEDSPGLEVGHASLDGVAQASMGLVQRFLAGAKFFAGAASSPGGEGAAGSHVGQDRDPQSAAGVDDAVSAGRGEIVSATGQHP